MIYNVLFICLGNICRSPIGLAVFRSQVARANLKDRIFVDSCGTGGWHEGEPAHKDSRRIVKQYGLCLQEHRARQLTQDDLNRFNLLVAMDQQNKIDTESLTTSPLHIKCLREFDPTPDSIDVPDPYFGGPEGFDEVYKIIERSCDGLLEYVREQID